MTGRLRRRRPGRLEGAPTATAHQGSHLVRGRLAAVSIRASIGAGAWVGFALGLTLGVALGALVAWLAGAVLSWQRDLAFTLGITRRLLPFGDQVAALQWLNNTWFVVVPAVGLAVALAAAVVGGLLGGILAASYNRSPRHAAVVVELPDEPTPGDGAGAPG